MSFYITLTIEYLNTFSPRWSSGEHSDVDDIDLSEVGSDSEEDFDSVDMDYEAAIWQQRERQAKVYLLI